MEILGTVVCQSTRLKMQRSFTPKPARVGSLASKIRRHDARSNDADRPPRGKRQSCLKREAGFGEAADNSCLVRDGFWSCDDIENSSTGRAASDTHGRPDHTICLRPVANSGVRSPRERPRSSGAKARLAWDFEAPRNELPFCGHGQVVIA
jgi:hypothetical protein